MTHSYRPEIDGLRAIAILPVILFHAGIEAFSGGFVGVDVFFVISGYLITRIILADLAQGTFSLAYFYERRARRILPALFLVMALSCIFAWFWLLPIYMKDFAQSLAAVSLYVSNILFWHESGYFAPIADLKPLLHTWSLAVEEQFYVLFPLCLMLIWRFGLRCVAVLLIAIMLASLGLAQWGTSAMPSASFYLLPMRAWELLIGSLAALYLHQNNAQRHGKLVSELGGALGLALIAYSVLVFDKTTPFPSVYTLVPTVGAAFIILFASSHTWVGKILAMKLFVGIGLISYSAYLWHQPLFAFARHRSLLEPSQLIYMSLAVASLVLAFLTWKYVETPFRDRALFSRRKIIALSGSASAFFIAFGLFGHFTNGTYLLKPRYQMLTEIESRFVPNTGLCSVSAVEEMPLKFPKDCQNNDDPEVLVWGDSFAMHLVGGLVASDPTIKIAQRTLSFCGPILDIAPLSKVYPRAMGEQCIQFNNEILEYIKQSPTIKYVVMSSSLGQYLERDAKVLTKDNQVILGAEVTYQAMLETMNRVRALGKIPILFSPPPLNGQDIGSCLMKATLFRQPLSKCDFNLSDSLAWQAYAYALLSKIEAHHGVVRLNEGLCDNAVCRSSFDDILIYLDAGHLSIEGSAYLGKKMGFYNLLEAEAKRVK